MTNSELFKLANIEAKRLKEKTGLKYQLCLKMAFSNVKEGIDALTLNKKAKEEKAKQGNNELLTTICTLIAVVSIIFLCFNSLIDEVEASPNFPNCSDVPYNNWVVNKKVTCSLK